jgi:hypothetical protein
MLPVYVERNAYEIMYFKPHEFIMILSICWFIWKRNKLVTVINI